MAVFKVQVSSVSSDGVTRVLVYNRDRSVWWQGDAAPDLLEVMAGREKAFFAGSVGDDGALDLWVRREMSDPGW